MLDHVEQSDDFSIKDRGTVAMELTGIMTTPALVSVLGDPDKTTAQIKADLLKELTPLDGLTARQLIEQIDARQKAEAQRRIAEVQEQVTEAEKQAYALLDQLRAQSATHTADYFDLIGRPEKDPNDEDELMVRIRRVIFNPQKEGAVSLLSFNSRSDALKIYKGVSIDKDFAEALQSFRDKGEFEPGEWSISVSEEKEYSMTALADIAAFEPQFKEWERIAKEAPTPEFLMLFDGRRVDFDGGLRAADHAGKRIPAFSWNGSEAAIALFEPEDADSDCTWYSSDFFIEAKQMLATAAGWKKVSRSSIQKEAAARESNERSINERFTVANASRAATGAPLGSSTGSSQSTTVNYTAKIGADDLLNSKGVFLPDVPNIEARDILLQERFNYHQKGMRDPEDTNEGLYEEGKDTMRKHFEGKVARLADGGDLMVLLASEPVIDVTLTESEIIVTPVE